MSMMWWRWTHAYGCGVRSMRRPRGADPHPPDLANNPNFGAKCWCGLGLREIGARAAVTKKAKETGTLRLQGRSFVLGAMIDGIMEKVEERLKIPQRRKREPCGAELIVGMQCGAVTLSPAYRQSGLASAPICWCRRAHGDVLGVTEVREPLFAEPRAATKEVAEARGARDALV